MRFSPMTICKKYTNGAKIDFSSNNNDPFRIIQTLSGMPAGSQVKKIKNKMFVY